MTFRLTILFILLVFWRPQDWLFPWLWGIPLLDAVFLLSLLTLLIECDERRQRFPTSYPHIYLVVGIWVASVMSQVVHTYFAAAMTVIPLVLKYCAFTVVMITVLDRAERLRTMAILLVGMGCLISVHCLLQQSRGYGFTPWDAPILVIPEDGGAPYTRSYFYGIFNDPNDTAQILAAAIPFAFAIPRRLTAFKTVLTGGVVALLVMAIQSTHSRGGQVALVVAAGLTVALLFPTGWQKAAMAAVLVGFLALCPYSSSHLDESAHDRVAFWGEANQVFKRQPLFGVGATSILDFVQTDEDMSAHNAFVMCYTEIGLFGYWFWYGLLQLGIVGAWRSRTALKKPQTPEQAWLKRFAGLTVAATGGYFASAFFLTRAFVYPTYFMFGLLGAIPVAAKRILAPDHPPLINVGKDLFLWCTVGTVLSVAYIYTIILILNRIYY